LPKITRSTTVDALLQRGSAWGHDKGTAPTLSMNQVMAKIFALSKQKEAGKVVLSYINAVKF
jgi:hypothetical protein